jgi:Raf kinase inhibitor-like YbhB/YbcL family protein
MWNIPVISRIEKNSSPGIQGKNGKNENKYTGPCPPSGTHHYNFKVYALDIMLDLSADSDKNALLKAMDQHILASGGLIGLFNKQSKTL